MYEYHLCQRNKLHEKSSHKPTHKAQTKTCQNSLRFPGVNHDQDSDFLNVQCPKHVHTSRSRSKTADAIHSEASLKPSALSAREGSKLEALIHVNDLILLFTRARYRKCCQKYLMYCVKRALTATGSIRTWFGCSWLRGWDTGVDSVHVFDVLGFGCVTRF